MEVERSTVRVAIDNDYPVVVVGLTAMLAEHAQRVQVFPLGSDHAAGEQADLILKDAFAMTEDVAGYIARAPAPVVLFAGSDDPQAAADAIARGAAGYIHKGVDVEGLVTALQRIVAGERVVEVGDGSAAPNDVEIGTADWPGRAHGLTDRESEVLSLICQGLSNREVAQTLYLSINSVKTYIRTLYRKIDVDTRSRAVIWGLQHGFSPRPGSPGQDVAPGS
jgi:two-component system, NarL family, response regulator LiaR